MRYIRIVLAFMLGFLSAQYSYGKAFDPVQFWDTAKQLAAQAYYLGCVEHTDVEAVCKVHAVEFFRKLSGI